MYTPCSLQLLRSVLGACVLLCGLGAVGAAGLPPPGRPPAMEIRPPEKVREPPRHVKDFNLGEKTATASAPEPSLTEHQKHALAEARYEPNKLVKLSPSELEDMTPALDAQMMKIMLSHVKEVSDSELARFVRERHIDPLDPGPGAGKELIAWVLARKIDISKNAVRALSSSGKWLLDAYIAREHPRRKINFDSEVEFWENWESGQRKRVDAARAGFSAFSRYGSAEKDIFADLPDQHEARYLHDATRAFIAAHPPLARLQSEGWRIDDLTIDRLGIVLDALLRPIPGTEPILTYFIDPKSPDHDLMTSRITEAWNTRSDAPPSYLLSGDIDTFLADMRGKTVILVGHIAEQYFAMDRGAGTAPLMLDIPVLLASAAQHGVLLVPIGCNSGKSGAPYGFTRTIDSNEIANFIAAIPRTAIQLADVLAAMGKIGTIIVDHSNFAEHIDVILRPKLYTYDEPVAYMRIPSGAYAPSAANVQPGYGQFTAGWIVANRPWHDRGWLGAVRAFVRHTKGAGLAVAALALLALQLGLRRLRRWREGTTAPTATKLYRAECTATLGWVATGTIAILYVIIAPFWIRWPGLTSLAVVILLSGIFKALGGDEDA
jgi:hypothetical protein